MYPIRSLLALLLVSACAGSKDDILCPEVYPDADRDGHVADGALDGCDELSDAEKAAADDCDDVDASVYPGAVEVADGQDDDCDGIIDEGTDATDDDGDGYSEDGGDCDDGSSAIYPGATEIPYDGIDQDCSSADLTDVDGDGYDAIDAGGDDPDDTDAAVTPTSDADHDGYTPTEGDCDDEDPHASPGVPEICDEVDNDCDGEIDEDDALATVTCYLDFDGDGHGYDWGGDYSLEACACPDGYAESDDDCDDTASDIYPDADEICDGVDDDCDGETDEDAIDAVVWYADDDGDEFGDPSESTTACEQPDGYVADTTDCDPDRAWIYPGAPEVCDGLDDDCDSSDAWSSTAEAGQVAFISDEGELNDLTDEISRTEGDVTAYTVPGDGELEFCGDPADPATWYVNLTVDDSTASIGSPSGLGSAVLSGGGEGSVIYAQYSTVDLADLVLTDGAGTDLGGTIYGGAACLLTCSTRVDQVRVTENSGAERGGGIYVNGGTFSLTASEVSNNDAASRGGGMELQSSSAVIDDVLISDNRSGDGGGVALYATYLTISDTWINGNTASGNGGGVALTYTSTASMASVGVQANTASGYGGGFYVYSNSALDLDDGSDVGENGATYGGGITAENCAVIVEGASSIHDNSATRLGGGAFTESGTFTLSDGSSIEGNSASEYGGGVYNYGNVFVLANGAVVGNSAMETGGGIMNYGTVYCTGDSSSSAYGIFGNVSANGHGDGVWLADGKTIYADHCDMTGSEADSEADIYAHILGVDYDYGDDATFTCDASGCL